VTLFKRSNDVEVSVSPEFDKEYSRVKRPSALASIDAAGADVRPLPTAPDHCRWTNTPGARRLKWPFDGGWPSPRSKNRTERRRLPVRRNMLQGHHEVVQIVCAESHVRLQETAL
jgi:hypothetical protein